MKEKASFRKQKEIDEKKTKRTYIYTVILVVLLVAALIAVTVRKHNIKTHSGEGTTAAIELIQDESTTALSNDNIV